MSQASTALSLVTPAGRRGRNGGLLHDAPLRGGSPLSPVGLAVAVTGIWNQLSTLAFPIIGLALLTREDESHAFLSDGRSGRRRGPSSSCSCLAFALALSRSGIGCDPDRRPGCAAREPRSTGCSGSSDGSPGAQNLLSRFRAQALELLRRRWHVLTLATLAGHLTVFVLVVGASRPSGVTRRRR